MKTKEARKRNNKERMKNKGAKRKKIKGKLKRNNGIKQGLQLGRKNVFMEKLAVWKTFC